MKTKLLISIAFIAALAIFAGCGDDEPTPTACFEMTSESIDNDNDPVVGEEIEFTNCSENATEYEWDFGDDGTSTKESPKHTYEEPGEYTVTLTATGAGGTNETTQDIVVQGSLTGTWEGTMILEGDPYPIVLDIQQNGSELEGSFEFGDGSGHSVFTSGSEIDGQEVTLKFTEPSYNLIFVYTGDVNDAFDEMDGTYTVNIGGSMFNGTWDAAKTGKKSAINLNGKGLDSFLKKF